jgi:CelD/BcsL family acetyltransferase involved in cellulose biosynthesis
VKASVCLPGELGAREIERWRELQSQWSGFDSPFLSPVFTMAVGRARPQARVAIVEDGGKPVAFFPFERRRFGLAVAIGFGLSDCQAIISEPDAELDMPDLLRRCGISAWRFDHLMHAQRAMVGPRAEECVAPTIDLTIGFQAYLAGEGRRSRNVFQKERKLAREVGPVRFDFGVCDDAALAQLMAWKSEQYRRTCRADRFSNPANVQLIRDLSRLAEPDLAGTLITLRAGDRLMAVEFSLRSATTLASWFPAHDCEYARYSPGSILRLRTIEAAGLAGLRRNDLGKGDEDYKNGLKTGDLYVCDGWAIRPSAFAYLRRGISLPRETVEDYVLRHHRLRATARSLLEKIGSTRLALGRAVRPPLGRA